MALAAALAMGCRIIVIDEALNMLDRPIRRSIRSLLSSLAPIPGLTVIEVTHNLQDALTADRILFLSQGTVFSTERLQIFFAVQTEAAGLFWPAALRA